MKPSVLICVLHCPNLFLRREGFSSSSSRNFSLGFPSVAGAFLFSAIREIDFSWLACRTLTLTFKGGDLPTWHL